MRFSIIVPAFNVEGCVGNALASLFSQEYPRDDYEVILVDDCSTDATAAVAERFAAERPDAPAFSLLRHTANARQGAGRNTGMRHARGEWLMFLDADDCWMHPGVLSQLSRLMDSDACAGVNQITTRTNVNIHDNSAALSSQTCTLNFLGRVSRTENLLGETYGGAVWQSCYRRSSLLEAGCWFREKVVYEDADWTRRAAWSCQCSALIDFPFYGYAHNPLSTTRKPRLQTLLDMATALDALFTWARTEPSLPQQVREHIIDPDGLKWLLTALRVTTLSDALTVMRHAKALHLLDAQAYPAISAHQRLFCCLLSTLPSLPICTQRLAFLAKRAAKSLILR